jgi:drug/metabolite transporter (DMT)-like permease
MAQPLASTSSSAGSPARGHERIDVALAWYFVVIWGASFLAVKTGLRYAAPFTLLSLRYVTGVVCVIPLVVISRPVWPATRRQLLHVCVAGLLVHAIYLSASGYSQYLGMSAGVTALTMAAQPLLTAMVSHWLMGDRLSRAQWLGVGVGLIGVALVVWHKINIHAISIISLAAVGIALLAITIGTLYQRVFCKDVDLRSAALIQFIVSSIALVPLAYVTEGFAIRWSWELVGAVLFVVVFTSLLGVNALHTLMRRGHAAKVTSLFFLVPIVAVLLEWVMFDIAPTPFTVLGVIVTCAGVALVSARRATRTSR